MQAPFTSIWERYIFKNILKMFCLCLLGFYGLYVLINYSSHSSSFHHYHLSFLDIIKYYLYDFITQFDYLAPFALLIATTFTLCSLNAHNELTALLMAGVTYRRILAPFFLTALLLVALLYTMEQFATPLAALHSNQYEQLRARFKHSKRNHPHIQQILLDDGTSLIFQNYNGLTNEFEDAYWVRSIDDLFRIRSLKPGTTGAVGEGVEHLLRDNNGNLVIVETLDSMVFEEINVQKDALQETIMDPDGYSLSTLHDKSADASAMVSEKDARILTAYYRKLAIPLACFLAILIPAPLCLRFTRVLPAFYIYATSIFSMVLFFLVMNAASLLGDRQSVPPALAIGVPIALFFLAFGSRLLVPGRS